MKTKFNIGSLMILIIILLGLSYQSLAQGVDTTQTIHANIDMSNDWLHVDSIRVRAIHVGDSSLVLGSLGNTGTGPTQNLILVNQNRPISFGRQNGTTLNGNFPGVNIGTTTPTYMLHIHDDGTGHSTVNNGCYAHFTNNFTGNSTGNGFLVGIDDNPGNAYLIQRNPLDIKFYTNNTFRAIIKGNNTISTIGGDNTGYVGIGNSAPLSLLHVGDRTTISGTNPGGWRNWMINGGYFDYNTDNLYVGMKDEGSNRKDAIIAWGDDMTSGSGPDNLRFIFNEQGAAFTDVYADANDGLEVMRLMPFSHGGSYISTNVGIGNYYGFGSSTVIPPMRRLEVLDGLNSSGNAHLDSPQFRITYTQDANINKGVHTDFETTSGGNLFITPVNNNNNTYNYPDYKLVGIDWPKLNGRTNPNVALDVNGQVNIDTALNQDTLARVLVWDYKHAGNVKWRRANTLGGVVGAQNGTSIVTGKVELGLNPLLHNTDIPLAGFDLTMDGTPSLGHVGIGVSTPIFGRKLTVYTSDPFPGNAGLYVQSDNGTDINYGIISRANAPTGSSGINYGMFTRAYGDPSMGNHGVYADAYLGTTFNTGIYGSGKGGVDSYGVYGSAKDGLHNYGVYGLAPSNPSGGGNNYAGYFAGDLHYTGAFTGSSDSILKLNVQTYSGDSALKCIKNLKPKTYEFDTSTYSFMNLSPGNQYGLIAQDVQDVLPDLVKRNTFPAAYDTTGTMIHDSVAYLGLNYTGLIPILVGAVKQLDSIQTARPDTVDNGLSLDPTNNHIQWGGAPLLHNTEVPMVNGDSAYNVYFTGQAQRGAQVGVGHDYGDVLPGKLDVKNVVDYGYFIPRLSAGNFNTTGSNIGADILTGVTAGSYADNAYHNIGGLFNASGAVNFNVGVKGIVNSGEGTMHIGVWGDASGSASLGNVGVYGVSSPGGYAGYFDGDVYSTGSYLPSDLKLKNDVKDYSGTEALNIIDQLKPKTYSYKTKEYPSMVLPESKQYGLISEEVEQVLPTLVKNSKTIPQTDSLGKITAPSVDFKALNYTGLVPILIAATKQLDSTNKALAAQLAEVKLTLQQLQNCCSQSRLDNGVPSQSVVLSSDAIILDQNSPNPFAEQTTITYTIPESVGHAQIIFYDNGGHVIKTVEITTRGAGSLLVYASNLSSGIYTYSLIADGKLIDSKKMAVQK